ncbi:GlxA family transcriptional regulator [Actinosynnema pretiosum]|uniref:GlxA family transcriptional regulator n=1 Tax=Actinosynnema pretiosum TaxID=42197 RepID=UPI0015A61961|nr:helix-turn-helix domain-containing protein [Actinosynnema pretiosum]
MRTVAVLALDDVIPFDLSTPLEVFSRTALPDGSPAYRVVVCGERAEVGAGLFSVRLTAGLEALAEADTIIVPGTAQPHVPPSDRVLDALREAAGRGAVLASICSGAFALAATGLLDGRRATTHWIAADRFRALFPAVELDPDVLYVDNGALLTSAGAAAGLDLCLHLVRRDHGSETAAHAARLSVVPLEREGGQAQFIPSTHPVAPEGSELEPLLAWLDENCARELTVDDIAARAAVSTRTLNRRFRAQTGTTPLRWLHVRRVRLAQRLLEATGRPVDLIAGQVGFGSPTAFRDRFKRVVGTSPQAYRAAFRGGGERGRSSPEPPLG